MKKLKLIYTSDIHGSFYPEGEGGSFLQCLDEFEKDSNTLVIDGGDIFFGSSSTRFMSGERDFETYVAPMFNHGNYDYVVFGNHDFDGGYEKLRYFANELDATCLLANVVDKSKGINTLPFDIRTMRSGMNVGITGIVTDFVNVFQSKDNLAWLTVTDAFEAAKKASLDMDGLSDIKICVYHGGFENDLETDELLIDTNENIACKICRELDFDILLTAHQHTALEGRYLFGTYVMQLPARGKMFGEIHVEMEAPIISIHGSLKKPGVSVPIPMLELLLPIKSQADRWLEEELCLLYEPLINSENKIKQAILGCPLADFVNHVFLETTGADISCASLPNNSGTLPPVLTVKHIVDMFSHANRLLVLEITGEILYEALMVSGSYFKLTPSGFIVDPSFLRPREEHYHYDFFANVRYSVLCNPHYKENKVADVWIRGEPIDFLKTYTIAMSEFRASGVGGYDFYAKCPIKKVSKKDIQLLLIDYCRKKMPREIPSYHGLTLET